MILKICQLSDLLRAKESAKAQGGTIKHEFTLIKGFTQVPPILYDLHPFDISLVSNSLMRPCILSNQTITFMSSKMAKRGLSELAFQRRKMNNERDGHISLNKALGGHSEVDTMRMARASLHDWRAIDEVCCRFGNDLAQLNV